MPCKSKAMKRPPSLDLHNARAAKRCHLQDEIAIPTTSDDDESFRQLEMRAQIWEQNQRQREIASEAFENEDGFDTDAPMVDYPESDLETEYDCLSDPDDDIDELEQGVHDMNMQYSKDPTNATDKERSLRVEQRKHTKTLSPVVPFTPDRHAGSVGRQQMTTHLAPKREVIMASSVQEVSATSVGTRYKALTSCTLGTVRNTIDGINARS
ncbi:hypothetical protein EV126DRAFT_480123 [Verticillium dahliae]|nr:hypothetical protein EV126DRAFT_480123 [Verticillium dahliae]